MRTSTCGRCGAEIAWARTTSGKSMPIDPTPNAAGNVFCQYERGVLIARVWVKSETRPEGTPFMPHWATCGKDTTTATKATPEPPAHEELTLFG